MGLWDSRLVLQEYLRHFKAPSLTLKVLLNWDQEPWRKEESHAWLPAICHSASFSGEAIVLTYFPAVSYISKPVLEGDNACTVENYL